MKAKYVADGLQEAGVKFVVTVPDSRFNSLFELLKKNQQISLIVATNEGEGVAIASGLWLSGSKAAVAMEGPGLFIASNALDHLGLIHGIPTLLLISLRGLFGDSYWWFDGLAKRITEVLDALDIQYEIVGKETGSRIKEVVRDAQRMADARKKPTALLFGVGVE